jgi:hypothetical protein
VADSRWFPLEAYCDMILADLDLAIETWETHARMAPGRAALVQQKAFQKSLQDAYSTFEQAAIYILGLAAEPRPTGEHWHDHLLQMIRRASDHRPAFAPGLAGPLRELRLFRRRAMHSYAEFDMDRAAPSVDAARRLLAELPAAFDAFGREFGLLPPSA